jgi:hypothetical protein
MAAFQYDSEPVIDHVDIVPTAAQAVHPGSGKNRIVALQGEYAVHRRRTLQPIVLGGADDVETAFDELVAGKAHADGAQHCVDTATKVNNRILLPTPPNRRSTSPDLRNRTEMAAVGQNRPTP